MCKFLALPLTSSLFSLFTSSNIPVARMSGKFDATLSSDFMRDLILSKCEFDATPHHLSLLSSLFFLFLRKKLSANGIEPHWISAL